MRGWSGQSIHPILFALGVIIDKTRPARKGISVHKHRVLIHSTNIRVTNALLDLISIVEPGQISIVEPGQIFFKYGVQVSRTIIGDPTITSNDAPQNLRRFWVHQSLNRIFLPSHTSPTIIKEMKLASSVNIVLQCTHNQ